MTNNELKPCPFCGGKARLVDFYAYHIECKNCGASIDYQESKQEAIAIWNERAFEPEQSSWLLYDKDTNIWQCSDCGNVQRLIDGTPFEKSWFHCPNCGARIEQEIRPESDYDGEEADDEQE